MNSSNLPVASPEESRATHVRWLVFALGASTSWLLYLHRYTFALIKPKLSEELNISNSELGLLDSAFSTAYMLFQVPTGMLADFAGTHWVLPLLVIIWSIALAMHAWAPNVSALWWARALFGVGQSGAYPSLSRLTRKWFPATVRGSAQGFIGVFAGRIGGLSAYLLIGYVMIGLLEMSWQTAVYILAGAGLVHAVFLIVLYRDSPRQHRWANKAETDYIEGVQSAPADIVEVTDGPAPPQKMTARRMIRQSSPRSILNLIALIVQSVLSVVADNIYSNWIPLFLFQVHGLEFKKMGIYSALPLLGGALGGVAGGWLNDALIARTGNRRWSRSGVAMFGKGAAAVILAFAIFNAYDDPQLFCWLLFAVKFFGDWSLSTSWATVTDISGRATASVFAFNNSIASVGAIFAPAMYGYVAQHFDWRVVFLIACGVYAACALSWLAIDCTIPVLRDDETQTGT